ncbi:hypothetical protein SISNIDRAFT_400762, partial [Sistotremastrum niveocremeum HHB9708]
FPLIFHHSVELNQDYSTRIPGHDYLAPECPFMSISINVGPNAVCRPHVDMTNLAFGLCIIFVFGRFDATLSGHLVLCEAKIILEGPSGTVFFIPSGSIHHLNTALRFSHTRCVMTLYTQAGLFRFRDQGFKTQSE